MPLSYSLYTAGYISVWTHIDVVVACVIAIFLLLINHCSSAMATCRRSYLTYYCWLFWYSSYYATTTTTATTNVLTTKHNSPQLNHLCMFASAQGAKAFAVTCGRQMIHYTKFDIWTSVCWKHKCEHFLGCTLFLQCLRQKPSILEARGLIVELDDKYPMVHPMLTRTSDTF
jgi:hypothetical protein